VPVVVHGMFALYTQGRAGNEERSINKRI
jgi:hypothetical protein